jgi:hypothetical protein
MQTNCGLARLWASRFVIASPWHWDAEAMPPSAKIHHPARRTGAVVGYWIGLKNHALRLDQLADRGLDGGLGARRRAQLHASIVEMKIDRSLRQPKRLRYLP